MTEEEKAEQTRKKMERHAQHYGTGTQAFKDAVAAEAVYAALTLDKLASLVYNDNRNRGFWPVDPADRNFGEAISLMHSELSEALEAHRKKKGENDDKIPYDALTVELADCMIRILDWAGAFNLPLGDALMAKLEFNRTRPFKHGKRY